MSKTLDDWAAVALPAIIVRGGVSQSDIPATTFDIAQAMKEESEKRNDSHINQQLKGE